MVTAGGIRLPSCSMVNSGIAGNGIAALISPNFEPMVAMPVLPQSVSKVEKISTRNGEGM